jgi:succinate dehydrogenase / fumarate reductase cytochrome b subunit
MRGRCSNTGRNCLVTTTATAPDHAVHDVGGRHYFLLRRLHSLTGLVFGGYLVIHLLVNATLVEGVRHAEGGAAGGPTVFQIQVDKIHSLPFLPLIEWTLIYLPILYHTFYGIWITATAQPNNDHYPYGKNWFYLLQRVSAIVLVFFMVFHILGMRGAFGGDIGRALTFVPANYATQSTARHFNIGFWVWGIIYPIGILASCYHLANGFWTAGITWGLTVSKQAMQRWGVVCTLMFIFTFGCGMTALVSLVSMGAPTQPIPTQLESQK